MSSNISCGRERRSTNGKVPKVAREKIYEAFFVMQHVHVTLEETWLTTLEKKQVHADHHENATIVATTWHNVMVLGKLGRKSFAIFVDYETLGNDDNDVIYVLERSAKSIRKNKKIQTRKTTL